MQIGTPTSRNEWISIIFILLLLEFIFLHTVYTYGQDVNVLNYWSFAGTITSIILAVIAIIYGFVQTITQQTSAETLARQVDSLRQVVADVQGSKQSLEEDLQTISRVTAKLEEIGTDVKSHDQSLRVIQAKIEQISKNSTTADESVLESTTRAESISVQDRGALLRSMLAKMPLGGTIVLCALVKLNSRVKDKEVIDKAILPNVLDANAEENLKEIVRHLWVGTFMGVRQCLYSLEMTDEPTDVGRLSETYMKSVEDYYAKQIKFVKPSPFDKISAALDELAKGSAA